MECGIYQIRNTFTGKSYVGKSINISKRWTDHKNQLKNNTHPCRKLQRSWNKYSDENIWEWNILEICLESQLSWLEAFWMARLEGIKGYNEREVVLEDGRIINRHSEETKQQIRLSKRDISQETRQKIREANLGKKRPEWVRKKMSEWQIGRTISEESKQKIRNSITGQKRSEESRKRISEAAKKREQLKREKRGL